MLIIICNLMSLSKLKESVYRLDLQRNNLRAEIRACLCLQKPVQGVNLTTTLAKGLEPVQSIIGDC